MKKVGLITYHAAYNFGSVLQSFATQYIINNLGYDCKIVNYRMNEQKKAYKVLNFSSKRISLGTIMSLWAIKKRIIRNKKYEAFIQNKLDLTNEFCEPEDFLNFCNKFDIMVSGSDQILNKHSNELVKLDWKYMNPYLLYDFHGKKISYASSVSNMSDSDLKVIKDKLQEFDFFSSRESSSIERLEKLLHKAVSNVLDPTLLLNKNEWVNCLKLTEETNHDIVYYSLRPHIMDIFHLKKVLIPLAKRLKCKVKIITPYITYILSSKYLCNCSDYDPIDFLNSINNARLVITDSYHGTLFSINFQKNFYSICKSGGSEFRKTDILKKVHLSDRIINSIDDISKIKLNDIDFENVNSILEEERKKSINYLITSLGD